MAVQHLHSWLIFGTFILCLIAALLHIIAFATSSWLVSDGNSPFVRLGWHEACFNNCHFPYCPGGDRDIVYNDCYVWTFNEMIMIDERFREIKEWLMPAWFSTARTVFIVNIPMSIICCILLLICTCWTCKYQYTTASTKKKDVTSIVLLYTTLCFLLVSTQLNTVGMAIFQSNAPLHSYMPMPYKNHFGYSFWLDFAVCIILGICCFVCFLAAVFKTLHVCGPRDPRYAEDTMMSMSMLTSSGPAVESNTLLNVVGIAIFSSNAPLRNYMPMPYKNHFGYSFWLDFTVCILLGVCSIFCFLAAVAKSLHFKGPKDPRYAEDMMLGRI